MKGDSVIVARKLTKIYGSGGSQVTALGGIDLSVRRGEMIAIVGTSGSGKSTLMNILGCLDYPTSGAYVLDGERVDELDKNQLADIRNQKIGFVFQGFNLLGRTSAVENVELPLLYDRSGKRLDTRALAEAALERVGLGDRMDHEPSELSGGQQQRVAIARALVTQPAILLADEPTGNLDSANGRHIVEILLGIHERRGTTIVLATHDQELAEKADRLLILKEGRIERLDGRSRSAPLASAASRG
jgi:putative ABC transport system ATP-binding protein